MSSKTAVSTRTISLRYGKSFAYFAVVEFDLIKADKINGFKINHHNYTDSIGTPLLNSFFSTFHCVGIKLSCPCHTRSEFQFEAFQNAQVVLHVFQCHSNKQIKHLKKVISNALIIKVLFVVSSTKNSQNMWYNQESVLAKNVLFILDSI